MVDDHLIFLVTIPIHYGSNESSEKGSERSSETTAISSGTSQAAKPSMGTAIQQRSREKHTRIRIKCDFCEKTTKIALKNGLNIDLGNNLFVY